MFAGAELNFYVGPQPLRKKALEAALEFHQRFLEQRPDDPVLQAEVAMTYCAVGLAATEIGSDAEALAAFQKGCELLESLVHSQGADSYFADDLAQTLPGEAPPITHLQRYLAAMYMLTRLGGG